MTQMSRFPIHDELTAPEGSVPLLKAASAGAGQLPNVLGVLAGSPAVLRAYTRFRAEMRATTIPRQTAERIAIAVAQHHRSAPGLALHERTARRLGLGIDEVMAARAWRSSDAAEQALLHWLEAVTENGGPVPVHLHEAAREAGWADDQLLEALALVALESFTSMVNVAGEVPVDGSVEASRMLHAA
jgi:AhpD family alkylhydroperoxidase